MAKKAKKPSPSGKPKPVGRPEGAKAKPKKFAVTVSSQCVSPRCNSTQRAAYRGIVRVESIPETVINGVKVNFCEWKPTKCLACSQSRIDRVFSFNE